MVTADFAGSSLGIVSRRLSSVIAAIMVGISHAGENVSITPRDRKPFRNPKLASGAMQLEFYTNPRQPYAIEATTNFLNWQGVITNSADGNGLIQFDDTNAVAIPYRFYRGNSAP